MPASTPRQIGGVLLQPDGAPFGNKSMTVYRDPRATIAQGNAIIADELVRTTLGPGGEVSLSLVPGWYMAQISLMDADRYFGFEVPDAPGPFVIADLVKRSDVNGAIFLTLQDLVLSARAWAENPEDDPVVEGPDGFSALHHAAKALGFATQAGAAASTAVAASQQPYPDLAAAIAALPDLPAEIGRVTYFAGPVEEGLKRQVGASYEGLPAGWVPEGRDISKGQVLGEPNRAVEYIQSLPTKRSFYLDGSMIFSEPVNYENSRSDTWREATDISNQIQPGSSLRYDGSGNTAAVTSATNANPAVFTAVGHGFQNGEQIYTKNALGGTWPNAINGGPWEIINATVDTFSLRNGAGNTLSGVGLGALSSATFKNSGAIAGINLMSTFSQSYRGLVLRSSGGSDAILSLGANDYFDNTDFSGHIAAFYGCQFQPQTNAVADAQVIVSNQKFASFDKCWLGPGLGNHDGIRLGVDRAKSPNTLMNGVAAYTQIQNGFLFSDIVLENTDCMSICDTQFDGTTNPVRLTYSGNGVAKGVSIKSTGFTNDGGATGTGLPAIEQAPALQQSSSVLNYTGGWGIETSEFRDWPIGVYLGAGMSRLSANQFRGRVAGNRGIVIGENARGEVIDASNDFTQTVRAGNVGIEDRRYKSVSISGATQTTPVVVTFDPDHHFQDGDRIRISGVVGMTEINNREFIVEGRTSTTCQLFTVDDAGATSIALDGTGYGAYSSGGTATRPYMWHREIIGGQPLSLGHSDIVFDLALANTANIAAGTTNVLNMSRVPIIGGHYEVTYASVVDMDGVSGRVRFDITIAGTGYAFSSFERAVSADDVHHFYQRRFHVPSVPTSLGSVVRFRCNSPGNIRLRGNSDGSLGSTFCQIRRIS